MGVRIVTNINVWSAFISRVNCTFARSQFKKNTHSHLKSSINIDLYKSKQYYIRIFFKEEMRLFYWKIFHCATCILLFNGESFYTNDWQKILSSDSSWVNNYYLYLIFRQSWSISQNHSLFTQNYTFFPSLVI